MRTDQLGVDSPDLIVFPEYVSPVEVENAASGYPNSIIVGAIEESGRSRGVLLHNGHNQIDYLKVRTDGHTEGSGNLQQNAVYEIGNVCIGVLLCMDIDDGPFSRTVIERVRSSKCGFRLVCVPASMSSHWCPGGPQFEGVHLILCNHTKFYQDSGRCKSFVAGPSGNKIAVQKNDEPISATL